MAHALKYKTPAEDFDYTFDFVDEIPAGEAINAQAVTATDSAGTDASSTVVGTVSTSGTNVTAHLQAGTDWEDYFVLFNADTDGGDSFQKLLELRVRSSNIGGI
jgi:hypothetical protein